MAFRDAGGVDHRYLLKARSLRRAKREARNWLERTEWDATLIDVTRVDQSAVRRLVAVAGVTFVVSSVVTIAAMIFGLSLEGAL